MNAVAVASACNIPLRQTQPRCRPIIFHQTIGFRRFELELSPGFYRLIQVRRNSGILGYISSMTTGWRFSIAHLLMHVFSETLLSFIIVFHRVVCLVSSYGTGRCAIETRAVLCSTRSSAAAMSRFPAAVAMRVRGIPASSARNKPKARFYPLRAKWINEHAERLRAAVQCFMNFSVICLSEKSSNVKFHLVFTGNLSRCDKVNRAMLISVFMEMCVQVVV